MAAFRNKFCSFVLEDSLFALRTQNVSSKHRLHPFDPLRNAEACLILDQVVLKLRHFFEIRDPFLKYVTLV